MASGTTASGRGNFRTPSLAGEVHKADEGISSGDVDCEQSAAPAGPDQVIGILFVWLR